MEGIQDKDGRAEHEGLSDSEFGAEQEPEYVFFVGICIFVERS
jgi:hypothetical protein